MAAIPMNSKKPLNRQTILTINDQHVQTPLSSSTISTLNHGSLTRSASGISQSGTCNASAFLPSAGNPPQARDAQCPAYNTSAARPSTGGNPQHIQNSQASGNPAPVLEHPVVKGQKVSLETSGKLTNVQACLSWNTSTLSCDVDVSAFLLDNTGKVPGDDWFVFYGQEQSPDGSTRFSKASAPERERISVDFSRLHSSVNKIVFVLTINEAVEKKLNFSMVQDACIRILDQTSGKELVSFQMTDYYENVISMMIGELYRHNGSWKFHAIGDGAAQDLAGLCERYGVQVV